jgi:TetR/AcrR family fatty acid metabolism transcriptional regulator
MTGLEKIEARKVNILEAAAKVFSKKGFQDATISEIAKTSRTSEASIYDYFTTKENLLFSIPLELMRQLHEVMEYHLLLIRGSINKVYAVLNMQLMFYKDHPEFTAVLLLILKHNRRFIDTESHKEIRKNLRIFDRIIEEGIESGEFRKDINPYYVRSTFIGTLEHIIINWLMVGNPKDLMEASDQLFDICVRLLQKDDKIQACPFMAGK